MYPDIAIESWQYTCIHKGVVTNYGEGGLEKVEKVLAILKGGGGTKSFGVDFTQ